MQLIVFGEPPTLDSFNWRQAPFDLICLKRVWLAWLVIQPWAQQSLLSVNKTAALSRNSKFQEQEPQVLISVSSYFTATCYITVLL